MFEALEARALKIRRFDFEVPKGPTKFLDSVA